MLVKAKGECTKEDLIVWERSIREDLKDIAENIVFPFHSPNQALVQFATVKGKFTSMCTVIGMTLEGQN